MSLFSPILPTISQEVAPENTPNLPFTLEADDVQYNATGSAVTASGNVLIESSDGMVEAEKVIYDAASGALTATGNVTYKDPQNNTLFLQKLELTGDLKSATLQAIRFRLPNLGDILTADKAERRNQDIYELHNIAYSPCKTCTGERKPWQIRAKSVKYNTKEETLSYQGAKLDIYGVPVLYLPYFYHPIGQTPKSGILPPKFGQSTSRGSEITLSGYLFNPESNSDYTFRNRLMTERGAQFILERRQKTMAWDTEFRGSYINDTNTGDVRSHGQIMAEKVLEKGRRVGVNAELTSDDDYLSDYFERNDAYLASTAYFEDSSLNHYVGAHARWYQNLDDTTSNSKDTSHALPQITTERFWALDNTGTQLQLSSDFFALYRDEGINYQRISSELTYLKPWKLKGGSLLNLSAGVRGDIYNVEGSSSSDDGQFGRFIPEISLGWEKPFISESRFHTITPKVAGIFSPRGGNPDDIPNEDSAAYELDVTNLFQSNRFAGLDRIESGPQLIYGLENRWGANGDSRLEVFFGQSIRQFDDDALPVSGGTATKVSDWVGYVQAQPAPWLSFATKFRLDNADFNPRRLDNQITLGSDRREDTGRFASLSHTFLDGGEEEVNARGRWTFNDTWGMEMRVQRDLAEGDKDLLSEVGLTYTHNCFKINGLVRRSGFENSSVQPSTDYLINFELLSLGRDYD